MNIIIGGSIGSALITYEIIAIFGYLTFGSKVCTRLREGTKLSPDLQVGANIIAMYPSTSIFVAVGQLAIVILVLFSYPLQVHPCRNSIDKVLHPEHVSTYKAVATDVDEDNGHVDEHNDRELPTWKFALITIAIIVPGFSIAFLVSDLRLGEPQRKGIGG
jgi:amino acid permease